MSEQKMREALERIKVDLRIDDPHEHYDMVCEALASAPAVAGAELTVPREPTDAMLDRAVALMLCAKISGNYSWTQYARDLWATMIAGSCSGNSEMRTRPAAHVEEAEKSEHDVLSYEQMFAAWVDGGGWQADFDSRAMRSVIAAHEAKKAGGAA